MSNLFIFVLGFKPVSHCGVSQQRNGALCKYHIVFAPKYRRKVVYQKLRADIGHILSELCKRKGIEIIAAEACPDHIHIFVIEWRIFWIIQG